MSEIQKDEALAQIRRAKLSHIRWRAYAQGLVGGIPVDEERVPVSHTACQFGHWYTGDGARQLGELATFRQLAEPHEKLHAIYAEVYGLVQKKEFVLADARLDDLVAVSRVLLDLMDRLEQEVSNA
jgi:hypothetical protein